MQKIAISMTAAAVTFAPVSQAVAQVNTDCSWFGNTWSCESYDPNANAKAWGALLGNIIRNDREAAEREAAAEAARIRAAQQQEATPQRPAASTPNQAPPAKTVSLADLKRIEEEQRRSDEIDQQIILAIRERRCDDAISISVKNDRDTRGISVVCIIKNDPTILNLPSDYDKIYDKNYSKFCNDAKYFYVKGANEDLYKHIRSNMSESSKCSKDIVEYTKSIGF